MKNLVWSFILLFGLAFITLPACNRGYGCEGTEKMQGPESGTAKKGIFKKKNKSKSGKLF